MHSKTRPRYSLYCFSPPVMIATCVVEIALLVYTVVRYRFTPLARLVVSALALLATFQLCEFRVCRGGGPSAAAWSRIGFVAITLLPPMGLHIIRMIARRGIPRWLIMAAYASAAAFGLLFGLSSGVFQSHVCGGNYAIFQLRRPLGGVYFAYYYGWLVVGIGLSIYLSMAGKRRVREALLLQAAGCLVFLLPTGVVNQISPQTIAGIPSIMCGFAVLYAFILAFGIVPRTLRLRTR